MAYYAALVSSVQFLEEIKSLSEHQYPNSLFRKVQIVRLYETLRPLQELLEDYSPNDEEAAGFLDRIRDAACLVQDLIVCRILDEADRAREIIQHHIPDSAFGEGEIVEYHSHIPNAAYQAECIIVSQGSRRSSNCFEGIICGVLWHFVSACHNSENVGEEAVFTVRKGYEGLMKFTKQLRSVVRKGYLGLENMMGQIGSINMGKGCVELVKLKEELDRVVVNGYQDLLKLKDELDAIVGYQEQERVKEVVDFIVGRGRQDLERVTEEVDSISEKGHKVLCDEVIEEVDYIVNDLKRIKEKSHTAHRDDLQVGAGVSAQGPSGRTTMVGFGKHLKTLKDQLFGHSSKLEVISIVGMGGIGKSTLARNIFNDKHIENHFEFRVWVTVSQNYHFPNILLAIVNSLNISKEDLNGGGERLMKELIRKHLFSRRYLVIMDDVWDTRIWDDVKWILPDNEKCGSRVILTTRQSDVASLASAFEFKNKIPILQDDQSWDLFCGKVVCPPKLEDIGRSIVKGCGGLPLAIVVVAGLLSKVNTTRSNWKEIARGMTSTAAKDDEHFSKILSLSYNYLPHHLKPCFLYFGGFPEDCEVSVSRLIKLWVAEGFLKSVASKSLEEVAEEYLEELVERNLILISKWRANGKFRSCIIHDLLRDLCSERARHEHFLAILHRHSITGHIHRFFVHPNSSSDISFPKNDFLQVHSFLSFGDEASPVSIHSSNFKPLRVLDAPYNFIRSPDVASVSELLQLRYIVLLRNYSGGIDSSVSKLQNLQTLIVVSPVGVMISLPSEIWKMPRLRHVMIDQVVLPPIPSGARIPRETPLLGMLQTLGKVMDFRFDRDTIAMIPNLKKLKLGARDFNADENYWAKYRLENLVDLIQLETLDIYFFKMFSSRENYVIPFPVNFTFPLNLKKLSFRGCSLPLKDLTIVGSLPNLQVLKLRWNSFVGREWEPIEGQFPKLRFLLIERLHDLEHWEAENTHFPCLEQLHIIDCSQLTIPSALGDIPTLQLIELHYCSSFVESRALEIQQQQEEFGNSDLQVRCISN